jgi:hypothetical protein
MGPGRRRCRGGGAITARSLLEPIVVVSEVEARMRANGERPPRGDIHTAAVEEVAETADMKPEALMKRIQRLRGRVPGGRT